MPCFRYPVEASMSCMPVRWIFCTPSCQTWTQPVLADWVNLAWITYLCQAPLPMFPIGRLTPDTLLPSVRVHDEFTFSAAAGELGPERHCCTKNQSVGQVNDE